MDNRYFNELSKLHTNLPPVDTEPRKLVNFCLNVGKQVIGFGKNNPHLLFAALQSTLKETPQITRSLLTVFVTQKINNANEHFTQHVIASVLATYWASYYKKHSNDKYNVAIADLRKFISRKQLKIWLDIIALQKIMFTKDAIKYAGVSTLNSTQRRVLYGTSLAYFSANQLLSHVISQCAMSASADDRNYLVTLLILFERPLPLSMVTYKSHSALVLATHQDKACIQLKSDENEIIWVSAASLVSSGRVNRVPLAQYAYELETNKEIISSHPGKPLLPGTYPISRPPPSLTAIIDALQRPSVNIKKLSSQIDEHEAFSAFLLTSASHDNRLQLPVTNIKQAILTYGIERIGDMLVQFALIERLTQHYYPLRTLCIQFTTIASHIAGILCSRNNVNLTPQSAGLILTFLCAPLFTLPGLKVRTLLPVGNSNYFQPNQTFKVVLDGEWHDVAGELANKWHQSKRTRALLHQSSLQHNQVSALLKKDHAVIQLSFGLAREFLFGIEHRDHSTSKQLSKLLSSLELTLADIKNLKNELDDVLWCPL